MRSPGDAWRVFSEKTGTCGKIGTRFQLEHCRLDLYGARCEELRSILGQ